PIGGATMLRRSNKYQGIATLPVAQIERLGDDLIAIKPFFEIRGYDVAENAFDKQFNGGQPDDVTRYVSAINRKLDFVELAFGRRRGRFKTGETIEAGDFAQPMYTNNAFQKLVPR